MSPPKEPKPVDPGVLGGLSRTRPQRRSTRRSPREDEAPAGASGGGAAPPATPVVAVSTGSDAPVADAVKAARKAAKRDGAGKTSGSGKGAAKSKAKAAAKAKTEAAKPKAGAAKAKPKPAPTSAASAPAAPEPKVVAPADELPPSGYATPDRDGVPSGTELVATALQAAGEVGRLGKATVRGLLSKLPKP